MFRRLMYWGMIVIVLGIIGCSSSDNAINIDYLGCNETSGGSMAETETGFFYVVNEILYYADKDDMNKWVAVCNKPDCTHKMGNTSCNAYIENNSFVQQGEQLYGVAVDFSTSHPYIYEVGTDGSGLSRIYDIPVEENIWINSFSAMLSQEQLVFYYKYIEENGMFRRNLVRLEDDSLHTLYTDCVQNDNESVVNMTGNVYWKVRGDDVIISSLLTDIDSGIFNSLWDIDGEKPVRVNTPEDVSLLGAYVSDDTFKYFKQNEGFYEVDLESGEKKLIFENQLKTSRGYILTEKYMIECNRYVDYKPKEAYLKFYNGEQWLDVKLPEEVKKSNAVFSVVSIASDRIFIKQSTRVGTEESSDLYYFMLEDKEPELVFCAEIGAESEVEATESTNKEDTSGVVDIEDIVVFDTEDYFFKITSIEPNFKKGFRVNVYWENYSEKEEYEILMNVASVNGIFNTMGWLSDKLVPQSSGEDYIYFGGGTRSDCKFVVDDLYDIEQYTDIQLAFQIFGAGYKYDRYEHNVVNIYPYGEEAVIRYEYEIQDTDYVVLDNEYATVIVRGYNQIDDADVEVELYILNKSDQVAIFIADLKTVYINGNLTPEVANWCVGAGQGIFASFVMEEIGKLDDIEEIKWSSFVMRDYMARDKNGNIIGEIYFQEEIILNP